MRTPFRVRVNVVVDRIDVRTRRVVARSRQHNLVVDTGLARIRDFLYGDSVAGIAEVAIGTSGTAPASSQTALGTEVFRGPLSQRQKSGTSLVIRFAVSSQQANGNTIREAGLFTTDGVMYARVTPEEYVKSETQAVLYTWTLSFEPES